MWFDKTALNVYLSSFNKQPSKDVWSTGAKTYHSELLIDRGCSWAEALKARDDFIEQAKADNMPVAKSGFYMDTKRHGADGGPLSPSLCQ